MCDLQENTRKEVGDSDRVINIVGHQDLNSIHHNTGDSKRQEKVTNDLQGSKEHIDNLSNNVLVSASHQGQSYKYGGDAGYQNNVNDSSMSELKSSNVENLKNEEENDSELGISVNRKSEEPCSEKTGKSLEDKQIKSVVFDNPTFEDDGIVGPKKRTSFASDNINADTVNNVDGRRSQSIISGPEFYINDTYAAQRRRVTQLPLCLKTALVIGNCFLVTLPFGFLIGLGVLFVEIIDEFNSTRAEAFPIISVYTGIMLSGGALLGPFLNRYNGGIILVMGTIGNFIGCIVCYLARSIIVLVIGQALTGLGLSLTFLLPFTVVGEMFEERKVTMLTVVSVFIGVGNVYFPFLISVLNDEFGWRATFLILGAFFLNCIPAGILIMIFIRRRERLVGSEKTDFRSMLNLDMCKNPAFLVTSLNCFIMNSLFTTLNTFLVDMMRSRHFDIRDGPFLLSLNGFASIGGRVLITVISPFLKCKRMTIWPLFLFLCCFTVLSFAFFETYTQLLVICILYGIFWGTCAVLYPAVVMEISGMKMYSTALGYINFTGGVAGLFGGPLVGSIKDATKSYDMVYYLSTGLGLLSCVLIIIVTFLRKYQERTTSNGPD